MIRTDETFFFFRRADASESGRWRALAVAVSGAQPWPLQCEDSLGEVSAISRTPRPPPRPTWLNGTRNPFELELICLQVQVRALDS